VTTRARTSRGSADPKNEPVDRVRELRDDIAVRVEALVRELDDANVPA